MVKVSENEYDSGSDKAPGLVTKRTLFVQDSTTDRREATYIHDRDHRPIVQVNPQAPHVVNRFDLRGRTVAAGLYSSSSRLGMSTDPTASTSSNRIALNETSYDERGGGWKTTRWMLDASDGSKDDRDGLELRRWNAELHHRRRPAAYASK